jgi:hypothetical protein
VKAGVPLTDFVNAPESTTNRYLIGPVIELRLPLGFAIEADALYRHYKFQAYPSNTSTGAWEFPLLAKYRFGAPLVRPYVDAGVAWDTLMGLHQLTFPTVCSPDQISCVPRPQPGIPVNQGTGAGVVLGGGLDVHALFLHISPEIRYTHWSSQHFAGNGTYASNQNQAEFLLGLAF